MKTRCRPGDRCVIVVDSPGCECNVGAVITVTQRLPLVAPAAWAFKDASRPLRMTGVEVEPDGTSTRIDGYESWTQASGPLDAEIVSGFYDYQLVPVRDVPEDERDTLETAAPAGAV